VPQAGNNLNLGPKLQFGSYVYAGDVSSEGWQKPQVLDVKNIQTATSNVARNVVARLTYTHAAGSTFTLTEASWIAKSNDGSLVTTSLRSSVDLAGDESQPFIFLQVQSDGSLWVYKNLTNPVGHCDIGHWTVSVKITADNADQLEGTIGFTVLPGNTFRYDQPAFRAAGAQA
jgi:hypothetical protein